MKKNLVLIVLIILTAAVIFIALPSGTTQAQEELIRIHIRANSNSETDQGVKYKVRDAVTSYLVPSLAACRDRDDAYRVLEQQDANIKKTADAVLKSNGFNYGATINLVNEYFPVRYYDDITVESGYYDALIIELGSGTGNNWWCVVYPPLCFVDAAGQGNLKYKSKLQELIDKYFGQIRI